MIEKGESDRSLRSLGAKVIPIGSPVALIAEEKQKLMEILASAESRTA
jgi:hypothetical protein